LNQILRQLNYQRCRLCISSQLFRRRKTKI